MKEQCNGATNEHGDLEELHLSTWRGISGIDCAQSMTVLQEAYERFFILNIPLVNIPAVVTGRSKQEDLRNKLVGIKCLFDLSLRSFV